jgi:hypothetical protein
MRPRLTRSIQPRRRLSCPGTNRLAVRPPHPHSQLTLGFGAFAMRGSAGKVGRETGRKAELMELDIESSLGILGRNWCRPPPIADWRDCAYCKKCKPRAIRARPSEGPERSWPETAARSCLACVVAPSLVGCSGPERSWPGLGVSPCTFSCVSLPFLWSEIAPCGMPRPPRAAPAGGPRAPPAPGAASRGPPAPRGGGTPRGVARPPPGSYIALRV